MRQGQALASWSGHFSQCHERCRGNHGIHQADNSARQWDSVTQHQHGNITIFDDPNAGTCSASCGTIGNGQGTRGYAINPGGEIAGFYTDNSARCHGFLRSKQGTFTQIDAPDAGTGPFPQGTFPSEFTPMGINPGTDITGFYVDASSVQHGFVRDHSGKITEFDPPGSILTNPNAIDAPGNITGFYFDANFVGHAFLRDAKGGAGTQIDARAPMRPHSSQRATARSV